MHWRGGADLRPGCSEERPEQARARLSSRSAGACRLAADAGSLVQSVSVGRYIGSCCSAIAQLQLKGSAARCASVAAFDRGAS